MELVLVVAVPLLMLAFMVLCGRVTESRLRVADAAHQAARAASTASSVDVAKDRARATAVAALGGVGVGCRSLDVEIAGGLQPGNTVIAVLSCLVDLSDLALLQVPGRAVIRESFASPVDVYRGADPQATIQESGTP
ncbi:pilus assembly protein TadE [Streptomyces sp. NPDC001401]|uniref:pilus assembly protein TadE n=1 Tax=Streptomyces sp. NPDC001401 TaxID=3364570 RepID=UPI0036B5B721